MFTTSVIESSSTAGWTMPSDFEIVNEPHFKLNENGTRALQQAITIARKMIFPRTGRGKVIILDILSRALPWPESHLDEYERNDKLVYILARAYANRQMYPDGWCRSVFFVGVMIAREIPMIIVGEEKIGTGTSTSIKCGESGGSSREDFEKRYLGGRMDAIVQSIDGSSDVDYCITQVVIELEEPEKYLQVGLDRMYAIINDTPGSEAAFPINASSAAAAAAADVGLKSPGGKRISALMRENVEKAKEVSRAKEEDRRSMWIPTGRPGLYRLRNKCGTPYFKELYYKQQAMARAEEAQAQAQAQGDKEAES